MHQGGHVDLLRRPHVAIHRVRAGQRGHAAIARPLVLLFEHRHLLGVFFHQRHPFAVAGEHQQFAFLFGRWLGQRGQKTFRLVSHAAIDVFQNVHRQLLSEHDLELASTHAEGFFLTQKSCGKLLQQRGRFARWQIEPRVDGPQFDLAMGAPWE